MNNFYEKQVDVVLNDLKRHSLLLNVMVEVGARDCKETIAFAQKNPKAMIHSFECNPVTLPECRERIKPYLNITLHEKAVTDYTGEVTFNVMPSDLGSSSILEHKEIMQNSITVPCITLKDAIVDKIDLLWIDAQGSELAILKGTELNNVSMIHSEVYFTAAYKNQPTYKEIRNYLNKNGFVLSRFSSMGRNFADAIFVSREYSKPGIPQFLKELIYTITERITGKLRVLKSKL